AALAGGLSGAFGLAGYLTQKDGSPDVVGPQVTTASSKLGGELFDRYKRVASYFTTEAQIVMGDYTKLREVASLAKSDPRWRLPPNLFTSTAMLELATRQTAYKALVPVAYPVLYD